MIVGILCETAHNETRVAMTPTAVRRIVRTGMQVIIESGAGAKAGFRDDCYGLAGAKIVASPSEVFGLADVICWVKPPAFALENIMLRRGTSVLGFMSPFKQRPLLEYLHCSGVETYAFELVPFNGATREFDALTAMSRMAGEIAYEEARRRAGSRGRALRTLILGFGPAGAAAAKAAVARGDSPLIIGLRAEHGLVVSANSLGRYATLGPGVELATVLVDEDPDVIVGAAARRGEPAPLLLDLHELSALRAGTVVVDLAGVAGGNCIATKPDQTVVTEGGVIVMHRSNFPTARPVAASHAYGSAMVAFLNHGMPSAFRVAFSEGTVQ